MNKILVAAASAVIVVVVLWAVWWSIPCGTRLRPHGLRIFTGEDYYRCPYCGTNEFGDYERIASEEAPWLQYGDVPKFEHLPNGKTKIKHGFRKENWPEGTKIIEVNP